jgi:hypothetical protein
LEISKTWQKDIDLQIQGVVPKKSIPTDIIVKLLKTRGKEKYLGNGEKEATSYL